MPVEFAKRADGDKGKGEVEERVGEIIRCLPIQLLHKSVEGMFKERKVEKKGVPTRRQACPHCPGK